MVYIRQELSALKERHNPIQVTISRFPNADGFVGLRTQ